MTRSRSRLPRWCERSTRRRRLKRGSKFMNTEIKEVVLTHVRLIHRFVKVDELIHLMIRDPQLKFVSSRQLKELRKKRGDSNKAQELLWILRGKRNPATFCKFVASLKLEDEHCGHQELAEEMMVDIPEKERKRINEIIRNVKRVERPLQPQLELQGCLRGRKFDEVDHRLWDNLRKGDYESFHWVTTQMRTSSVVEFQIYGLWFDSVAYIHSHKDHEKCISDLLKPALQLCKDSSISDHNRMILEGRLHLRLSQVLLVLGKNEEAVQHFDVAETRLQYVGKGYDKVQLLLRKAKVLSTTLPHDHHDKLRIENIYISALDCISDDSPFAFTCRPSLYLSKAAFHLGIAFGSKPPSTAEQLSSNNIRKARDALNAVSHEEIQPIVIRHCEHCLVEAELLRLEGDVCNALRIFQEVKQKGTDKGLNLVSIAEHRIRYLENEKFKEHEIDKILKLLRGQST